jgi:large subunit ribosomal protein L20
MPRAKRGFKARQRRKKIFKLAKGMTQRRKNVYSVAKRSVFKALKYAYVGRKERKRDFRSCGSSASTPPALLRHTL